jgi:hypothetical protein
MTHNEIVQTLKAHYSREIRKQLVKSILQSEKSSDSEAIQHQYQLINQIFSYVLKESGWKIGRDSQKWNAKPMEIMLEVFPKLKETQWYKEQELMVNQKIDVVMPLHNEKEEKA